jgi:hypothetical protein
MKVLSEKEALARLDKIKRAYRTRIQTDYEIKAKDCGTCETRGACCLDAHFVNVHITRLEAVAIRQVVDGLDEEKHAKINEKIAQTIEKYNLEDAGNTFACPLFEKETGCLVHAVKPVPCIQHACYDFREDLPPDELQAEIEQKIERLNRQTYGDSKWLPLPIYLKEV